MSWDVGWPCGSNRAVIHSFLITLFCRFRDRIANIKQSDAVPDVVDSPASGLPPPSSLWTFSFGKNPPDLSIDDQVSMQARRLLNVIISKRGPFNVFPELYFKNYQLSLPIINEDEFYWRLENPDEDAHFCALLLSIVLVTQLYPQSRDDVPIDPSEHLEELYPTLKSVYSMLQSTGKITLELIQTGILIASYEHTQALHQNAWMSIGSCVRMAHVLGLHTYLQTPMPIDLDDRIAVESRRRLWWGIVLMERYVRHLLASNTRLTRY